MEPKLRLPCVFIMVAKIDLYALCHANGFSLKEYHLEGRILAVLLRPKIIIKNSLGKKRKQTLIKKAISYLLNNPDCQLAIFWKGKRQFFHL